MTPVADIIELIDGETSNPDDSLDDVLTDSNTGKVLCAQRASSTNAVERAIATADAAHSNGSWSGLDATERAAGLRRLADELRARTKDFALLDSLDTGVPFATTASLAEAAVGRVHEAARRIEAGYGHRAIVGTIGTSDQWHLPWGPAAVFLPWNAPTFSAISKVAGALLAGCPVILKPSEWAPHFAKPLASAIRAAQFPSGAIQILQGGPTVGATLAEDPRIAALSYTGGIAGGRAVAVACATNFRRVELELSGNNPVIVLPDADPEECTIEIAGDHTAGGMLFLNGQWCAAPRQVFAPASLREGLANALSERLDKVAIGPTNDPRTELGPIANADHLNRLEKQLAQLEETGFTVQRFGSLPNLTGHFMRPTVVTHPSEHIREEVFGPIISLAAYDDIDEAITQANDHPYGLSAYVLASDRDAARAVGKRLRAGFVQINRITLDSTVPTGMGSMWASSGIGEMGPDMGDFFAGARVVG